MSRARSIEFMGTKHWFDTNVNHRKATAEQIELLAVAEDIDLDELLESTLTQGDVLKRLRDALGLDRKIPADVIARRKEWREQRQVQPPCRICAKTGDSTRHHFINKWILRELDSYERLWANRKENCIPICIVCHRDLHDRNGGSVSIAPYLNEEEKEFADRALTALSEQRPKLLILIAKGEDSVYEARLIKDWIEGLFDAGASATMQTDRPAGNLASLRSVA